MLRIEKASLLPYDTVPRATQICVKPFRLSTLPHSAILFIGSSLHPQALILLKIAPAARTDGLPFCSAACFISLVFRILFPLSLKRASSIYVLRSYFIKRPGIKYIKHLRAAVCKYREFAVKTENFEILHFQSGKILWWNIFENHDQSFQRIFFFEKTAKKWNAAHTMHIGNSKLCCFHFPTPVSTLQTWLTTLRPAGHAQKSRYWDFAVSSSLNILRTKTVNMTIL